MFRVVGFLFLFLISAAFGDDAKAPAPVQPSPIVVSGKKQLAQYFPATGKWLMEKDVKPEEVFTALLNEIKLAYDKAEENKTACLDALKGKNERKRHTERASVPASK